MGELILKLKFQKYYVLGVENISIANIQLYIRQRERERE